MEPLDGGKIGARGLLALEVREVRTGQRVIDGTQPVGPLRMAEASVVLKTRGMGEKQRGHAAFMIPDWLQGDSLTGHNLTVPG